jgi:hypothetical protein
MARVIADAEKEAWEGHKLSGWLKSKDYRRKEELYFSILASIAGLVGQDGQVDPRVLAEVLAVTIGGDGTFRGWVEKHSRNSSRLNTGDGWGQTYLAAAAKVVEKYERAEHPPTTRPAGGEFAPTREELTERVAEIVKKAQEASQEAEQLRAGEPGVVKYTPPGGVADMTAGLEQRLLATLEEEMIILTPLGEDLGIPESERDREVAKRALVRLRTRELRNLAREQGVVETGTAERVAERIAAKHTGDEAEIAKLVLGHEEETPENGYATRLVALHEPPDLARTATLLEPTQDSYVRIGVARWFVFNHIRHVANHLRVEGVYRYYQVAPKVEYEKYGLASQPRDADVEVTLRDGSTWMEVQASIGRDTRALAIALQKTGGIRPRATLPIDLTVPEGPMFAFDHRTVFMLCLLNGDLADNTVRMLNVNVAHFHEAGEQSENPRKPRVRSVRIGGQHLPSSRQACELIVAGQALLSFSGLIRVTLGPGEQIHCPFRADLADDHASIFTGITASNGEQTTQRVHELLVGRICKGLERTDVPPTTLALAPKIIDRAKGEDPEEADIVAPSNGEDTADGDRQGSGRGADGMVGAGAGHADDMARE